MQPYPDLMWVWDGFWRLSNKRPQGMNGPARIPTSEIEALARLRGWSFGKRNDFLFYVDQMDEAYMAHVDRLLKEQERRNQTAANKPQPRRRR